MKTSYEQSDAPSEEHEIANELTGSESSEYSSKFTGESHAPSEYGSVASFASREDTSLSSWDTMLSGTENTVCEDAPLFHEAESVPCEEIAFHEVFARCKPQRNATQRSSIAPTHEVVSLQEELATNELLLDIVQQVRSQDRLQYEVFIDRVQHETSIDRLQQEVYLERVQQEISLDREQQEISLDRVQQEASLDRVQHEPSLYDLVSPEGSFRTIEVINRTQNWSDSLVSLPVESVGEPVSEMYYTASSEVSLLSDTEVPMSADKAGEDSVDGKEGSEDRKDCVIAGHVAAMRERFESMTRTNTPCPDSMMRSISPSLDVFRNVTPSPDRLG